MQGYFNPLYVRVRAAEHAPRDPCRLLERRYRLVEIVERGAGVLVIEEIEPIARRVLGIAHPLAAVIQSELQKARGLLRAREAGKNVVFVR